MYNKNINTKIYLFIRDYKQENRIAPTLREISNGVGIRSISTVFEHLRVLEKQGFLTMQEKAPRSIRLLEELEMEEIPNV